MSAQFHYGCVDVIVLAESADNKENHIGSTVSQFVTVGAGIVSS